jgi:glycosyltransferase involved in cell wall biosynthesis
VSADILLVSVPSTSGWRAAAEELAASFSRAGARVRVALAGPVPRVRTFALTDYVEARAARKAVFAALAEGPVGAIVYCSMTAALLGPRPGAIWLDSVAAENRPGRHGVWQRVVERRRLERAPLVLAMSPRALQAAPWFRGPVVVVPVPVETSGSPDGARGVRDIDVVAYGGNPAKKRLDFVLDAWSRARRSGERLVVAGIDGVKARPGVEIAGRMAPEEYRMLLRRARVFVAAPTREDYGIAPLEALADGCMLVTTPAPGGYPALDLARSLDPRLVSEDLVPALRAALDDPVSGYAERAGGLLAPFSRGAVDRVIAGDVLPRLLPGWGA